MIVSKEEGFINVHVDTVMGGRIDTGQVMTPPCIQIPPFASAISSTISLPPYTLSLFFRVQIGKVNHTKGGLRFYPWYIRQKKE